MESLVEVMNRLQDVFSAAGTGAVELPQIVAIGCQSSGKSSVVESLVGRSFLPRGVGMTTRRPLVLQLVQCRKDDSLTKGLTEDSEWGEFLHDQNTRYTDFESIRAEITRETERAAGTNKGICEQPITLKVFSSRVLNLTLVDLPGITKVPVGDQPSDIEQRLRSLVFKYISSANAIILAVIPGNTDMTTAEGLQMAREVDPRGNRTLAVVTKLDLMDAGTDAYDMLTGRVVPIKLGIVGVVNRSQQDIIEGKPIEATLADESKFLRKYYPSVAKRNGTSYLASCLQRLLLAHIKDRLPGLRARINNLISQHRYTLQSLGEEIEDKRQVLLQMISKFAAAFSASIQGTSSEIETGELCGGARIAYIFHESFANALDSIDPLSGLTRTMIRTVMRNAGGTRRTVFVPEVSFELLVKNQIRRMEEPCVQCVSLVYEEMERIVHQFHLQRFPKLHRRITDVSTSLLRSRLPITNEMVKRLLLMELAYINTSHPDFIRNLREGRTGVPHPSAVINSSENMFADYDGTRSIASRIQAWTGLRAPKPVPSHSADTTLTSSLCKDASNGSSSDALLEREQRDCLMIEQLIRSYFQIVRKSLQDSVPKAIMYLMVNHAMDSVQKELVENLYKTDDATDLLAESEEAELCRSHVTSMLANLRKADSIIAEVRGMDSAHRSVQDCVGYKKLKTLTCNDDA